MKGSLAPSTLHLHLAALALLADSVGWDRPLGRISGRDIERFRAGRVAGGLSPASANRELRTLRRLFGLAALRGYLAPGANPCSAIPMIKVGRKRPAYCAPEPFQAILGRAPDVLWQALLVVLYSGGLRLREALNLTWADVDFAAAQVHLSRKGRNGYVQAWTPKDHERRSIPLPPQAIDLLSAWQGQAPEGCPYVFMEAGRWEHYRGEVDAGRWRSGQDLVNNILRRFRTLCRRAGVGPYTVHDLRRSCISNWAGQLPIHVVQHLAGHSDIQTTQQYYLSVRVEDVARAQTVQAALLGRVAAVSATDQKVTNSGRKRAFPRRKASGPNETTPDGSGGCVKRSRQESNL